MAKFLWGFYRKVTYLSLDKQNFCAVFTNSIERAREIRKFHFGRKKCVMHVQICCFVNINLSTFLSFSLLPSSLLKLFIVVIQNFSYRGNVMSHFPSLLGLVLFKLFLMHVLRFLRVFFLFKKKFFKIFPKLRCT